MQGLWTAEFGGSAGRFGGGVLVFREGKLLGGDSGYFYLGTYELVNDTEFRATIEATLFVIGNDSFFASFGPNLTLDLVGTIVDSTNATAQGHSLSMPSLRLGVKLSKRT